MSNPGKGKGLTTKTNRDVDRRGGETQQRGRDEILLKEGGLVGSFQGLEGKKKKKSGKAKNDPHFDQGGGGGGGIIVL